VGTLKAYQQTIEVSAHHKMTIFALKFEFSQVLSSNSEDYPDVHSFPNRSYLDKVRKLGNFPYQFAPRWAVGNGLFRLF
jgi:hypothetical protein